MTHRPITLRIGSALAVAAVAALPLAGTASAAPGRDLDCRDFPNQAAAQAALVADPTDPNRLDRDHDGLACEDVVYPGRTAAPAGPGRTGTTGPTTGTRPTGGTEPARAAEPTGAAEPAGPVAAVPAAGVNAGDGSAAADDGSGLAFVLTGFGVLAAAGAAGAVWGTGRRAAGSPPAVPHPRRSSDGTSRGRATAARRRR